MTDGHEQDFGHAQTARTSGPGVIALFLSLYLLILAFFILLVSISTIEEVKTQAVRTSLSSTFTEILPPTTDLTNLMSKTGEVISAEQFQGEIEGVFATYISAVKVEVVQPGRSMKLTFAGDELFDEGTADLRSGREGLLDRLVSSLSGRPPALRFDMELLIGSRYTDETNLPVGQTLQMRRAAAFARGMLARGAPPDSLSIGLQPGVDGEIVAWFFVRGSDEARIRFDSDQVVRDALPAAPQTEAGP